MGNFVRQNEWTFSGEVLKINELHGEFYCSILLRGMSQRIGCASSQICEFKCLVPIQMKDDEKVKKLKAYSNCAVSGHFETWNRVKDNGAVQSKTMFIVDYILEV